MRKTNVSRIVQMQIGNIRGRGYTEKPGVPKLNPTTTQKLKKVLPVESIAMNDIHEIVINIYLFILLLRTKIKMMSERAFENLLKNLDQQQTLYALYFRYL